MIVSPHVCLILLMAMAIDAIVGDPSVVWRRVPHPVVVIGRAIAWLDFRLNRPGPRLQRRLLGVAVLLVVAGGAAGIGLAITRACQSFTGGVIIEAVLVAVLLAQRSLYDHVRDVRIALAINDVAAARSAISRIVGRDPNALDKSGIARAGIESAAENLSDAVVAPALFYLVAGLPGMLAYKAINTADSMVGYRTARYVDFGWASARIDDLANLVPARLTTLLVALAAPVVGGSPRGAASPR